MVAALSTLGLLVLVFAFFVPKGSEASRLRGEVAAARYQLEGLSSELTSLREEDPVALAERLKAVSAAVPSSPEIPALMETMRGAAQAGETRLLTLNWGVPTPLGTGNVAQMSISMSVSGSYFRLARYLFVLEHLDRLTRVDSVSVAASGEGGGELSMAVTGQVFTTALIAGPGAPPTAIVESPS